VKDRAIIAANWMPASSSERMFEDTRRASNCYPLSEYIPFVAPRAVRLR